MQITKKVKMTQPNDYILNIRRYVTKIFQHFYQKNLIIILHKCIISNECLVGLIVTLKCKEISLSLQISVCSGTLNILMQCE